MTAVIGSNRVTKELAVSLKRDRILDAMVEMIGETSPEETKIADVVKRAGVARKTFYDNYVGKEEALAIASDRAVVRFATAITEAMRLGFVEGMGRHREIRRGLRAAVDALVEDPNAARLLLVHAPGISLELADRVYLAFVPIVSGPMHPTAIEEATAGALLSCLRRWVYAHFDTEPPELTRELFAVVVPT